MVITGQSPGRTIRVNTVSSPVTTPEQPRRIGEVDPPKQLPTKHEDWVRSLLAFSLFFLLTSEIFCALYLIFSPDISKDDKTIEHLKDILTMVLSPTVALFGTATGFYYGAQSKIRAAEDRR